MCILRCHIIFWGDKTITNLGITSCNVILQNVNVMNHKMRKHVLLCVGCNIMTNRVEILKWYVSLRRMLVCCHESYVYQGSPVISMMDGGGDDTVSQHFCFCNVLVKHSEVELWTAEMSFQYTVRLMNNLRLWIFCYRMNIFVKTFILFTEQDVIASSITDGTFFVIRPSFSLFATWSTNNHHLFIRPAEDFHIKTTAKTLNHDWHHFESTPRNCITLWTTIVN